MTIHFQKKALFSLIIIALIAYPQLASAAVEQVNPPQSNLVIPRATVQEVVKPPTTEDPKSATQYGGKEIQEVKDLNKENLQKKDQLVEPKSKEESQEPKEKSAGAPGSSAASSGSGSSSLTGGSGSSGGGSSLTGGSGGGGPVANNIAASTVNVEPFSGSANLGYPIAVPPGRGGIQPNLALSYSSSNRGLGFAGVSWSMDLGAIQVSTKKGVPQYNGSEIFTLVENGGSQELVYDSQAGFYRTEVEGSFSKIVKDSTGWVVTDKKGTKYYFGYTSDSKQYDPANANHIFRWALNRVEDMLGNYMTISYLRDQNQIYPQTLLYTGFNNASLILTPFAQVTMNYADATVASNSYIQGFNVTTAKRIQSITTSVNGVNQSSYQLNYTQSQDTHRDLLQSIVQLSADGASSLPPVTFAYTDVLPEGFVQATNWNLSSGVPAFTVNSGHWMDLGVRMSDLNADGYSDIIQYSTPWGGTTTNQRFLNTKNNSWASSANWALSMNPATTMPEGFVSYDPIIDRYNGLSLVDIDGDGYPDLVQNFRRDMYWGGQYVKISLINNGQNGFQQDALWDLPNDTLIHYELGQPGFGYTVPGATDFGDINGDGFVDVATSRTDNYLSHAVYLNRKGLNSANKGWQLSAQYTTSVDFLHDGVALVDLNGDSLADIIQIHAGNNSVYMNTGTGWVLDNSSPWLAGVPSTADLSTGTILADINGDGLVDLVWGLTVFTNTGRGWFNPSLIIPAGVDLTNTGAQFLDANADGLIDIIKSIQGQTPELYINQGKGSDLLVSVNNGVGAQSSIAYESATHYTNTFLPFPIPVVKTVTTSVSNPIGTDYSYTTNYNYAGGKWDATYREFQGFATVTVTDVLGNYTQTNYLQDHWTKGRPFEQKSFDAAGNLYAKSVSQWQTQDIVTNTSTSQTSKFVFLARSDNYIYDGTSTAKRTAQAITYAQNPQSGDVTQTTQYGEVDPATGNDIGTDKIVTDTEYVHNTSNWLLGVPKHVTVQDQAGALVSQSWFYYDGSSNNNAVPNIGQLTKKVAWLGSSTQSDPATTYAYDAYGNLQSTTDALGNTTQIVYDNSVHMFPVQTTNALNQTTTNAYYGINGVPLDNGGGLKGLWGQSKSTTDANLQTALSVYDVFGRPVAAISPLDSIALPSSKKTYQIYSNYTVVKTESRLEHGLGPTMEAVEFYDGLGRLIETKSRGAASGQYIIGGQTEYNSRGLPVKKYAARFTSNDLNTMDPINPSVAFAQIAYDAMGRTTQITNPDGTYSNVVYDHWMTTSIDENGHMSRSYVDASGRLIKKEEYAGADGRSVDYPAVSYTLYATTNYTYDSLGNLIQVMDAKGNKSNIQYDHLGRKTAMDDPDMGHWDYGYDSNGNLIWQTDAKNQTIRFSYDQLNRLLNKTDGKPVGPIDNFPSLNPGMISSVNVLYSYDLAGHSYSKGRLGAVSYDKETAGFDYDKLGREISSFKTMDNIKQTVNRSYDALNRLKNITYPNGAQLSYLYNAAGQIKVVSEIAQQIPSPYTHFKLNDNNSNTDVMDTGTGMNNGVLYGDHSSALSATGLVSNSFDFSVNSQIHSIRVDGLGQKLKSDSTGSLSFWLKDVRDKQSLLSVGFKTKTALLHMDGTQGSTNFTDEFGHTVTANGNAAISTAQSKFSGSANFDGAGDYLATPNSNDWNFGTGDFTVEFWIKPTAIVHDNGIISAGNNGSTGWQIALLGTDRIVFYNSNGLIRQSAPGSLTPGVWQHCALVRSGNTVQWYINGVASGSSSNASGVSINSDGHGLNIGRYIIGVNSDYYNGYLDELRISKGLARWTANFTPPSAAYSNGIDSYGMVLAHPDGISVSLLSDGQGLADIKTDSCNSCLNDGQWHLVNIVKDEHGLRIYRDNVKWNYSSGGANDVWFNDILGSFDSARIGSRLNQDLWFTGKMDDVRYYDLSLDDNQVAGLYNSGAGTEDENPLIANNTQGNNYILDISYNAQGQMTQIQYANGVTSAYTYHPLNQRLTRIYTSNQLGIVLQDLNYTYDALGQIKTITDTVNSATQTFRYDALNRLIWAQGSYGTKTYAYDEIGNITLKDGLTYTYAEAGSRSDGGAAGVHAVTSLSDGSRFKYDLNGNMYQITKGLETTKYAYDIENRLVNIKTETLGQNPVNVADYEYDGDGGRTKKMVYQRDHALYNINTNLAVALYYNLDGSAFPATDAKPQKVVTYYIGNLYEFESAGTTGAPRATRFLYLGSQRAIAVSPTNTGDPGVLYYHNDHLGGTNVISDKAGDKRDLTEYDPFGLVTRHDRYGKDFNTIWAGFTGKHLDDESGLMYYGARYYNPKLGRFITPDTIVQSPGNPQTLNRYTYCNNNPVNLIDGDGHFWFLAAFVAMAIKAAWAFAVLHPIITAAAISATINVATNASGIHNFGDFAMYAGIGAASGALGAGVGLGVGNFAGSALSKVLSQSAGEFVAGVLGSTAGGVAGSVTNTSGNAVGQGVSFNDAIGLGLSTAGAAAITSAGVFTTSYAAVKVVGAIKSGNAARASGGTKGSSAPKSLTVDGAEGVSDGQALSNRKATIKVNIGEKGGNLSADPSPISVSEMTEKSTASMAQMSEKGQIFAGTGSQTTFRDAAYKASDYGGQASDWVKVKSSIYTSSDGAKFETHWIQNIKTSQRLEYKTKILRSSGGN